MDAYSLGRAATDTLVKFIAISVLVGFVAGGAVTAVIAYYLAQ